MVIKYDLTMKNEDLTNQIGGDLTINNGEVHEYYIYMYIIGFDFTSRNDGCSWNLAVNNRILESLPTKTEVSASKKM
jgi:hypothetical protein